MVLIWLKDLTSGWHWVGLILRSEIGRVTRHTVLVRTATHLRDFSKVSVRRRRRSLPFQCCRTPGIIRADPLPILDAPEEVDNEWDLSKPKGHCCIKNVSMQEWPLGLHKSHSLSTSS